MTEPLTPEQLNERGTEPDYPEPEQLEEEVDDDKYFRCTCGSQYFVALVHLDPHGGAKPEDQHYRCDGCTNVWLYWSDENEWVLAR